MSDETYLQDNEDEKELERKYMELDLEKEQEHWQSVPGWKLDIKEESA